LNSRFSRSVLIAVGVLLLTASRSTGQTADGGPDPAAVRVRIGPLLMNPTISMPNLGIDTNVFHDPPFVTPRRDFTMTISPRADMWLRLGRTWLSGIVAEDIVWYQKYESESSANQAYSIAWKAPLNRVILTSNIGWVRTSTRPGFEIDTRAQRTEPTYGGSVEVRGFSKTFIGVRGSWSQVRFDEDEFYRGTSLPEQLDRTMRSAAVTLRHDLTPLTSLTFSGGRSEARFEFEPVRDYTADDYSATVTFDPAALLKGSARVGYTVYKTPAVDLEDYNGFTTAVTLAYTLLGSTRFTVNLGRSIESSYDISQPYYLQTGAGVSVAQQIFGPIDVVARLGRQRLEYRSQPGVDVDAPSRTDHIKSIGGGVGYRMSQDLRIGFNIDREERTSPVLVQQYEGLRYGTAITYGP